MRARYPLTTSSMPGSSTAAPQLLAAPSVPRPFRGWIQSPAYDVSLLLLAPIVGLPFLLAPAESGSRLALVLCGLLGFPHYLSTFTFYFWDESRAYHRERWGAYFVGPTLIFVAFVILLLADQPPLLLPTILLLWNAVHVARQSCGVLSIYRHRAGIADPEAKAAANAAIVLASLWMCFANIESHAQAFPLLAAVHPRFLAWVRLALGGAALAALLRLGADSWRRTAEGRSMAAPEALALVSGLALFHPYLWIEDSARATLGMLLGHFLQYLGLVWLLHRRRFREDTGSIGQRVLFRLSSDLRMLVAAGLCAAGAVIGGYLLCLRLGFGNLFQVAFQVLVFNHFYLDALFWAFREPPVRARLAPYLVTG